jgi:DNA-binding MarR family transcriptional regulator
MPFDALVASPARLQILTALATEPRQPFVELRRRTGLTDGNLTTHARRLADAGLIAIDKSINGGKPITNMELTVAGRAALESHARHLLSVLEHATTVAVATGPTDDDEDADDWID